MPLRDWARVEKETMNPLVARQVLHGEKLTLARIFLTKGAVVPEHHHENEQISMVESGRLRFWVDGEETIVSAGEMMQLPPNIPHRVEALEDTVALDFFAPVREDWIRGDDAYLRS